MLKTKKGEMTISTIVAIALAVVVLIFLIYGFSTGWSNLWGKISAFGGTDDNTDAITLACQSALTTESKTQFTEVLKTNDKDDPKDCCELIPDHGKDWECTSIKDPEVKPTAGDDCGDNDEGEWSKTMCTTKNPQVTGIDNKENTAEETLYCCTA
jgi:hypothetical protein